MSWARVAWVAGAYLVGTLPSTSIVIRALRAPDIRRLARRGRSEGDAHILIRDRLGARWAAVAITMDVAKGFAAAFVASRAGGLPDAWIAAAGVAVVAGHCFPPYARALAGRGLAAAAGVYLALLPLEMAVAGLVTVVGIPWGWTPLTSTIGFGSVPVLAAARGLPVALVAMGAVVFALILVRRLQGVREVVAAGVSWPRAIYYRTIHDASGVPEGSLRRARKRAARRRAQA